MIYIMQEAPRPRPVPCPAPAVANYHEGADHGAMRPMSAMKPVDDPTFMKNAAMGGLAEVSQGKLAAARGSTDAVKGFAKMEHGAGH